MEEDPPSPHHASSCGEQSTTELTTLSQPDQRPSSPSAAAFSFPTLNLDGSVPDLTAIAASTSFYPSAPPAALSSLGAKAKMAGNVSDTLSDGSLDAGYDMIDDISDISTDDHDTASLLSTQESDEGEMTPEGSMVDVRDEQEQDKVLPEDSRLRAQNALIDSYLSEDLETPRQSVVKDFKGAHRILFVSEAAVTDDTVSDVCLRIASALVPEGQAMDNSISRSVRLPPTPASTITSSALFVRLGEIELLVHRCVGANYHGPRSRTGSSGSYGLCIQGANSLQTSEWRIGGGYGNFPFQPLDLIVYYSQSDTYPAWFRHVHCATGSASPLSMHITGSNVDLEEFNEDGIDVAFSEEAFFHEDDSVLRSFLKGHWMGRSKSLATQRVPIGARHRRKSLKGYEKFLFDSFAIRLPSRNDLSLKMLLPFFAILLAVLFESYIHLLDAVDPALQVTVRRDALHAAWIKTTNSTDVASAYNVSHLLPYAESPWPVSGLVPHDVRSQTTAPNHIIISLPQDARSRRFPTVVSTHVHKRGTRLEFNQTQLVPGIYDITIRESDANGVIMVTMDTKNPAINVIAEPDFGMKALYRKKYEKASMEISKTIKKDVMVARKNAKSISNKLGLELNAGAAATKNVTSELAIYIARDLQVLANTAVSVFAKAASASNQSATNFKKELAVIRKDLIKLSNDVQKSLISTAKVVKALIPTTKDLKKPIIVSKLRARRIRDRIVGRRSANSTSASKELSLRLREFFKPDGKGSKTGSLADIARCSRSKNYRACRRAQKEQKAIAALASKDVKAVPTASSVSPQDNAEAKAGDSNPVKKLGKKKPDGSKKGKKGPKHAGKRAADGIKKNAKKTKFGPKKGKKWPLR